MSNPDHPERRGLSGWQALRSFFERESTPERKAQHRDLAKSEAERRRESLKYQARQTYQQKRHDPEREKRRESFMVKRSQPVPVLKPEPAWAHGADAAAFNQQWAQERRDAASYQRSLGSVYRAAQDQTASTAETKAERSTEREARKADFKARRSFASTLDQGFDRGFETAPRRSFVRAIGGQARNDLPTAAQPSEICTGDMPCPITITAKARPTPPIPSAITAPTKTPSGGPSVRPSRIATARAWMSCSMLRPLMAV